MSVKSQEALWSPEQGTVDSALSQKQFPLIIDEEEDLSNLYTSVVLQELDFPLLRVNKEKNALV